MHNKVYITGLGIISAIGSNKSQCLQSLLDCKSGIEKIKFLDTVHKNDFLVGEVKFSNNDLLDLLKIPKTQAKNYTRTSLLGLYAAKEAIANAGITANDELKTAIVSATTVGGMDVTESCYGKENAGTEYIKTHLCGDSTNKIADFLNIYDYRATISTACSSAANAIIHGARLLKHGVVDRVLAGGVDSLSKFTLNGFNSLMILDKEPCKPFDENRNGLNLGEGAGFIVLESSKAIEKKGDRVICKLSGYANANDAYHQTASSPTGEGAYLSMSKALEMSGLTTDDIDYINVHGTGTQNNDLSEGTAIKRIFKDKIPPFSSTKSFTGHTLAAAAAVEAVFSIMAIKEGIVYKNLNFKDTIPELNIYPELEVKKGQKINNVLSNSFGFGGNNSTLIFSK